MTSKYKRYKVYIPSHGETADGAWERTEHEGFSEILINEFLMYCYDNCDGWDWMKDKQDDLVVVIEDEDGAKREYTYTMDWNPVFYIDRKMPDEGDTSVHE